MAAMEHLINVYASKAAARGSIAEFLVRLVSVVVWERLTASYKFMPSLSP